MNPLFDDQKKLYDECIKYKIETDIGKRWEQGLVHHPKSIVMMNNVAACDWLYMDDFFCWKKGGDGDNGEQLMYLFDIIFELEEKKKE